MKPPQRHAIITRLIMIFGVLFLLPCVVMGAAIDVAGGVYGKDEGMEVVKGWGQCGGYEYSGPTECEDGFLCRKQHEAYHQCVPDGAKLTPVLNLGVPTRPPAASPEPTTPSLPPRTVIMHQTKGLQKELQLNNESPGPEGRPQNTYLTTSAGGLINL